MKPIKTPCACLFSLLCLMFLAGCGGSSEPTAPSQNELDAYLSANPEVANEEAPAMEADE